MNRVKLIQHNFVGGTKQFDYAYNNVNDITAVRRDANNTDGDGFKYDLTQQIIEFQQKGIVDINAGTVASPAVDNNMEFDGCGNRTKLNGVSQAFNALNQLDVPNAYDNDGDLQQWNGWTYKYDAQNRLYWADNPATSAHADFRYDGLNRQVVRQITAPSPTPVPTPTPSPTVTPTATPTPTLTPTPTPPTQCAPVTFSTSGGYPSTLNVSMSTTTAGATIFYTIANSSPPNPAHNGATPTSPTLKYTGPVAVAAGKVKEFKAVAYKVGLLDSAITSFNADNTNPGGGQFAAGSLLSLTETTLTTTITFSVWDDWELIEEYSTGSSSPTAAYLQGVHGVIKSLLNNVYYYQDSLGSSSHAADSTGHLLESFRYDLYGKPTYWAADGITQLAASANAVTDLFSGERFIPELGLYDLRNRFMLPELGRFLQPDPIGFRGDASNLYRYCGNDWENKADPTGLGPVVVPAEAEGPSYEADMQNWGKSNNPNIPRGERVEWGTATWRTKGKSAISISDPREGNRHRVYIPEDSRHENIVDNHSHITNNWDGETLVPISAQDVRRGNRTGRTQEVITANKTRFRYRPEEDKDTRDAGKAGVIEKAAKNGDWHRARGANPNVSDPLGKLKQHRTQEAQAVQTSAVTNEPGMFNVHKTGFGGADPGGFTSVRADYQ